MAPTRKTKNLINDVSLYLAHQCQIHPHTYNQFLKELSVLQHRNKISLLPITILELYNIRVNNIPNATRQLKVI